jgi:hypothetical protein
MLFYSLACPARCVAGHRTDYVIRLLRYALANLLYRLRFPSGSLTATDFRPHSDGFLLNAPIVIPAQLKPEAVDATLSRRLEQSFRWMCLLRFLLRDGDKVQFCLGTAKPLQQYMKAWSSRDDLAANIPPRDIAKYWGICDGAPAGR